VKLPRTAPAIELLIKMIAEMLFWQTLEFVFVGCVTALTMRLINLQAKISHL
jgi:hypothetical protein